MKNKGKLDFSRKPVIAMLHLKGAGDEDIIEKLKTETEIYFRNGVDAVLVENYFGSIRHCEMALMYLSENYPDNYYGVSILGDYEKSFELAKRYKADFVQIDSVCGHLPPFDDADYARQLIRRSQGRAFQILGGLRFKYQPICSGRSLLEDAEEAVKRCDAVVTTGTATGRECPTDKLIEFRKVLGDYPLIVGAGVTAENVSEKLEYADGIIVGSYLKDFHQDYGDVCEDYVIKLMNEVNRFREGL